MHLLDVNVWIALTIPEHPFHSVARAWFGSRGGDEKLLFCRTTQQSFLRQMTNQSVFKPYALPPFTNEAAWKPIEEWLESGDADLVEEPRGILPIWKKFSSTGRASTNLWMDSYLAAFAVAGGYRFVTTDKGFKQYKGLDLVLLEPK